MKLPELGTQVSGWNFAFLLKKTKDLLSD